MPSNHVGLIREAAARMRAGFAVPPSAYPLLADCLEAAAVREETFLAGPGNGPAVDCHCLCGDPEPGDEAALALALARAYLGRSG